MTATETPALLEPDDYFLSPVNPVATADQRDLEALAMDLVTMPIVREARADVKRYWQGLVWRKLTSERAKQTFEEFIDSFIFHYALEAANSDPNHPRIVRESELQHEWFGMRVPSARYGGDNPDTRYSFMPIDAQATFHLHGRILEPRPADQTISLMSDVTPRQTVLTRHVSELDLASDGSFTLVVSPDAPAPGPGVNHLVADLDTHFLYIRDSLGDWARERPMQMRIERVSPPTAPPLTKEFMALRTARFARYEVASMGYYVSLIGDLPINSFSPPARTPSGLVTQLTSFANLRFEDDEAVVVTVSSGGAGYHSLVLSDFTMAVLDTTRHVVLNNHATAAGNADGTITHVVAKRDPGVCNWLDSCGWNEVYAVQRWQNLREGLERAAPEVDARVVKIADLADVLPAETRWLTPDERAAQIAKRRSDHLLRFADH